MSKRRFEGEQTKLLITNSAMGLFSRKGYSGASIQDICSAAGCSKGNLYYHFKSKEDLFVYLEEQSYAEWWRELDRLFSSCRTVTEKLYAYGQFSASIERSLYSAEREFINTVDADSEAMQRFKEIVTKNFEKTQKFICEGIADGEFKNEDPSELTFIIMSFFAALNHYALYLMDNEAGKDLFRKATTLLLHGISAGNE
ncbi:MAG: TetR/AcrR family transcriptional regulator [Syntrophomonadaceae bacterium]|jgi:AcrR family transcriptional regulator|nr:TetR/AcrR family transcriptional regulator [Syntrophomonadaceae bacterium]